jgi:hypothetical protein
LERNGGGLSAISCFLQSIGQGIVFKQNPAVLHSFDNRNSGMSGGEE